MAKLNKKCLACGTKYSYCPSCSRSDALKPSWYSEFCGESCKDLWTTLVKYNISRLTKSEAKSVISELDLKPIESYAQCVQRDYAKIMAEEKKSKRGKRATINLIHDVADVPKDVVEQIIEESHEVVNKENE